MVDFLWLVRPADPLAPPPRKVWRTAEDGSITSDTEVAITFWRGRRLPLSGLEDVAAVLEESAKRGSEIAIRGDLRPGAPEVFQKKWVAEKGHPAPALVHADHRWIMLDLDKKRVTAAWDTKDGCIENAKQYRAMLPPPWNQAACVFRLSSSAGIPGKTEFGCHLYFWGDRAVCDASLRDYWKGILGVGGKRIVDTMLFQPQQPHFLAPPLFVGMPDPVCLRSGFLPGEPLILPYTLRSAAEYKAEMEKKKMQTPPAAVAPPRSPLSLHKADLRKQKYAEKVLSGLRSDLDGNARVGSRHESVRTFASRLRSFFLAGLWSEADCEAEMRWAQSFLPTERNPEREAASIWAWACRHIQDPAKVPDFSDQPASLRPPAPKAEPHAPKAEPHAPKAEPPAPKAEPPAPKAEPPAPKAEPPAPAVKKDRKNDPRFLIQRYEIAVEDIAVGKRLLPMFPYRIEPGDPPRFVKLGDAQGEEFLQTQEMKSILADAVVEGGRIYRQHSSDPGRLTEVLKETLDKLVKNVVEYRLLWWQERNAGSLAPTPYLFAQQNFAALAAILGEASNG